MPDGFDQNNASVHTPSKVHQDPDTEPEPSGTTLPLKDSGQAPNKTQNLINGATTTAESNKGPVLAISKAQLASSGIEKLPALGVPGDMQRPISIDPEELKEMLKMVFEDIDEVWWNDM